jgi:hypothetical protein
MLFLDEVANCPVFKQYWIVRRKNEFGNCNSMRQSAHSYDRASIGSVLRGRSLGSNLSHETKKRILSFFQEHWLELSDSILVLASYGLD